MRHPGSIGQRVVSPAAIESDICFQAKVLAVDDRPALHCCGVTHRVNAATSRVRERSCCGATRWLLAVTGLPLLAARLCRDPMLVPTSGASAVSSRLGGRVNVSSAEASKVLTKNSPAQWVLEFPLNEDDGRLLPCMVSWCYRIPRLEKSVDSGISSDR